MSKSRKVKLLRKTIRREYLRELSRYWELPFSTRIKLAWAITWGKHG